MSIVKIWLALMLATLLAACGHNQVQPEPPQFRNVLITPSASMTKNCSLSAPPAKEAYLAASEAKKIELLSKAILQNQGDVKKCNEQWKALRDWYVEQEKIHGAGKTPAPPPAVMSEKDL